MQQPVPLTRLSPQKVSRQNPVQVVFHLLQDHVLPVLKKCKQNAYRNPVLLCFHAFTATLRIQCWQMKAFFFCVTRDLANRFLKLDKNPNFHTPYYNISSNITWTLKYLVLLSTRNTPLQFQNKKKHNVRCIKPQARLLTLPPPANSWKRRPDAASLGARADSSMAARWWPF